MDITLLHGCCDKQQTSFVPRSKPYYDIVHLSNGLCNSFQMYSVRSASAHRRRNAFTGFIRLSKISESRVNYTLGVFLLLLLLLLGVLVTCIHIDIHLSFESFII